MPLYLHDVTSENSCLPHRVSSVGLPASSGCLWSLWWSASHLPLCLGRLSVCPLLGDPSPSPYGLQVSVLWPFPASTITRTVHRKLVSTVSCSLFIWPESGRVSQVWCAQRRTALMYRAWLALTLEPDDLRSNPSSTIALWSWQGTL